MKQLEKKTTYTGFFRIFKDIEEFNTFTKLINQYTTLNMYDKGWPAKKIQPNLGFNIVGHSIGEPHSSFHPEEEPCGDAGWEKHLNLSNQGIEVFLQYFIKHFPEKIKDNNNFRELINNSSLAKRDDNNLL